MARTPADRQNVRLPPRASRRLHTRPPAQRPFALPAWRHADCFAHHTTPHHPITPSPFSAPPCRATVTRRRLPRRACRPFSSPSARAGSLPRRRSHNLRRPLTHLYAPSISRLSPNNHLRRHLRGVIATSSLHTRQTPTRSAHCARCSCSATPRADRQPASAQRLKRRPWLSRPRRPASASA